MCGAVGAVFSAISTAFSVSWIFSTTKEFKTTTKL